MTPDDRLDAKRFNEFVRLLASTASNAAVAIIVGAVVVPYVAHGTGDDLPVYWLIGAGVLYVLALAITQFVEAEE